MQKGILGFIALFLLTLTSFYQEKESKENLYRQWKTNYGYTWSQTEDKYRQTIFFTNLMTIQKHNLDQSQTYKMGVNQFTAFTDEQFAQKFLTPKPFNQQWNHADTTIKIVGADIDWVAKGMVSPVKNQGNCGSCWAFSAVGTLQSYFLMKGTSVSLSDQQVTDCSKGTSGCNGGFNYLGLAYVQGKGITTDAKYPYKARTQKCVIDGGDYKISSVSSTKGCTGIITALASRPIGVSVDATNWSRYQSGIFSNCKGKLDHDVLLVGYTSSYYTIKNSWGSSWGEKGFIRLATGNTCGICQDKSPWPV